MTTRSMPISSGGWRRGCRAGDTKFIGIRITHRQERGCGVTRTGYKKPGRGTVGT